MNKDKLEKRLNDWDNFVIKHGQKIKYFVYGFVIGSLFWVGTILLITSFN